MDHDPTAAVHLSIAQYGIKYLRVHSLKVANTIDHILAIHVNSRNVSFKFWFELKICFWIFLIKCLFQNFPRQIHCINHTIKYCIGNGRSSCLQILAVLWWGWESCRPGGRPLWPGWRRAPSWRWAPASSPPLTCWCLSWKASAVYVRLDYFKFPQILIFFKSHI